VREYTDYIVVHCAATPPSMDIGRDTIDEWHKERGWDGIGYHFVIRRDGSVEAGRHVDAVGAHVRGSNLRSVGICMIGGANEEREPEENYTIDQWKSLSTTVEFLRRMYPDAKVIGHNEVSDKACPCFDVQEWLIN